MTPGARPNERSILLLYYVLEIHDHEEIRRLLNYTGKNKIYKVLAHFRDSIDRARFR